MVYTKVHYSSLDPLSSSGIRFPAGHLRRRRQGSCPPLQINMAHPSQLHLCVSLSLRGSDNERTVPRGGSVSQHAVYLPSQPV